MADEQVFSKCSKRQNFNLIQFDSKSNGICPIQTQSKLKLTSNQNLREFIRFQIEQA